MSEDQKAQPLTVQATAWGYLKPVLVSAITRGLVAAGAVAVAHGFPAIPATEQAAVAVLGGAVAFAAWAWGPIKAALNHSLNIKLGDAAPDSKVVVVRK